MLLDKMLLYCEDSLMVVDIRLNMALVKCVHLFGYFYCNLWVLRKHLWKKYHDRELLIILQTISTATIACEPMWTAMKTVFLLPGQKITLTANFHSLT